jgi:hypothetical protein
LRQNNLSFLSVIFNNMALQSSGAISLNDIQTVFGGTNPISMNEYYTGGVNVPAGTSGIPTSGTISINQFYGKSKSSSTTKKIYIFAEEAQTAVDVIVSNIQSVASSVGVNVSVSGYGGSGSGTLSYDSTVDVVVYWNDHPTGTGRGTQLQTYLDNGKGLVIGVFAHTSYGGPWTTGLSTTYQISNPGTYTTAQASYSQTNSTNHPILNGVSSVAVSYYNSVFTPQNSATAIGSSPNGGIVNFRDYGTNRRVDINTWYGDSSSDTTTSGRTRLLLNACLWAAKFDFSATYSVTIPNGTLSNTSTQCTGWTTFCQGLGTSYTSVKMTGSSDATGRTCTNSTIVNNIATNLKNGTTYSAYDSATGYTWVTGTCGDPRTLSATGTVCACETPGYTFRPCINNANWGGVGTTNCSAPTQTITITFA